MEIRTKRLLLRPLSVTDLLTTHEYASNKDLCKYMIFLPNETIDETLEFLQAAQNEWTKQSPSYYEFAVCLNGKHIGAVSLGIENETNGEIGWIISEKFCRKGYCTEAALALVCFAKQLGLKLLKAHCDTRNVASYRVMEKLGMHRVGENSREYLDERGVAREYEYSMNLD